MINLRNALTLHSNRSKIQTNTNRKFNNQHTLFMPFWNQRDKLGNLIQSTKTLYNVANTQTIYQNLLKQQQKQRAKQINIQKNMNRFFKLKKSSVTDKSRILQKTKKTSIKIVSVSPKKVRMKTQSQQKNIIKDTNLFTRCKMIKSAQLTRNIQSVSQKKINRNIKSRQLRPQSHKEKFNKITKNQKIQYDTNIENCQKYPQLARYYKMTSLQVKQHKDFQELHQKFLTKMKTTKQKAFDLKVGLQKIDNLYF